MVNLVERGPILPAWLQGPAVALPGLTVKAGEQRIIDMLRCKKHLQHRAVLLVTNNSTNKE
jgi:hypothetical protein